LAYPERIESGVEPIDLAKIAELHFHRPNFEQFPCLKLAFDALRVGGSAAALLNAANEIAVEAFLDRKIGFRKINELIATVMAKIPSTAVSDLESLLEQDQRARDLTHSLISS
jgi:1-deoxy-D-xylulose-5-phosphate reductoisomerase